VWQFFSGMAYHTPKLPCDPSQISRFRKILGEAGMEQLLKTTIETAAAIQAVKRAEFECVIVDTTVQEKAVSHPVDARLLEVSREKLVRLAKRAGIALKMTYEREGKVLRRRASGYSHAKQFKRMRAVLRCQRTILGVLLREITRKLGTVSEAARAQLAPWLQRAERIRTQKPKNKGKPYALHAPEVECIGKGKARKPYEFGVKASLAVTHGKGLVVGARTFPGNPYDGHRLASQLEQTATLLQDIGVRPTTAVVDLGYRGVDEDVPAVQVIHRGKAKRLTARQKAWLKPASSHRARDRTRQGRPPAGQVLVEGQRGRCAARGTVRSRLQHPLAAAGDRRPRGQGRSFCLRACGDAAAGLAYQPANARRASQDRHCGDERLDQRIGPT
jgi:IS5 family transposase